MSRPLVVTDCDEVLLHMIRHFRDWMAEQHGVDFDLSGNPFAEDFLLPGRSEPLTYEEKWQFLDAFFDEEMARQTPIVGAVAAVAELQREADVVVLTNLQDRYNAARAAQLRENGFAARVVTNQGPKGAALKRIVRVCATSMSANSTSTIIRCLPASLPPCPSTMRHVRGCCPTCSASLARKSCSRSRWIRPFWAAPSRASVIR